MPPSATATTVSATASRPNIYGDYDGDDHGDSQANDADSDDNGPPKDRDGDSDNNSGSYYDKDDKSVRGFGHAANARDRLAIASVVRQYFAAGAARDGASACSMLVSSLARAVPEDLGRSSALPYAHGDTCARVMSKLFRENHHQLSLFASRLKVAGVRVSGDRGLAVLGFRGLPGRQMGVSRESHRWKIEVLLDRELP
jgi:hypothetical protein